MATGSMQIIVRTPQGFPTLCFHPPTHDTNGPDATVHALIEDVARRLGLACDMHLFTLVTESGLHLDNQQPIDTLYTYNDTGFCNPVLTVAPILNGGKGGFGSMLRAQGGRMASKKVTNTDACRDLSGRRIKTVNDAKSLAAYIEGEGDRKRKKEEKVKKFIESALKEKSVGKVRFDDTAFEHAHEEVMESVSSAVETALANGRSGSSSSSSIGPSAPAAKKRLAAMWEEEEDDDDDDDQDLQEDSQKDDKFEQDESEQDDKQSTSNLTESQIRKGKYKAA